MPKNEKTEQCFICGEFFQEGKMGRFLPMDKRESGDNGFGYTFVCYQCVDEKYTRM